MRPDAAGGVTQAAADPSLGLCPHVPPTVAAPSGSRCEACGSTWNLRLCAECGHVGCCESQAADARAHALGAGHPVIYQLPLGAGSFVWCYEENRYLG